MNELIDDTYGMEGEFFVTICSQDPTTPLSILKNGKLVLTKAGKIAENYLHSIRKNFAKVVLEGYSIMPDHIHAIISIDNSRPSTENLVIHDVSRFEISFGLMVGRKNPFLLKGSIFHIITWLKSSSLLEIKKETNESFAWKSGYFDFTINDKKAFAAIQEYIQIVPENIQIMEDPKTHFESDILPRLK